MIKIVSALSAILVVGGLAGGQEPTMKQQVDEELARGQLYSGEKAERLVNLGKEAVPYLAERLYSYDFPLVILMVFAKIGDDRAREPLIQFIHSRRAEWSTSDVLCQFAIKALKEINDPRAEPVLYELATQDGVHFRLNFEATVALARLGSSQIKAWAWKTILDTYYGGAFGNRGNEQLITGEVFVGLCEVQSDEGIRLVSWLVSNAGEGYRTTAMLDVLNRRPETKDSPELIASIRSILSSTKEYHEYPSKMAALYTLSIHDDTANKDDLMAQYLELESRYENQDNQGTARSLKKVRDAIEGRDQ